MLPMPPKSTDEIMAHHEAGHAVAALALRVPLTRVTLNKTKYRDGAFDQDDPYDLARDAIFTLAGEEAEAQIHDDSGHTSEDDRKHFENLCDIRYPHDPDRRARWKLGMQLETCTLVSQYFDSIALLAALLVTRRDLSVGEVVRHLKWPTTSNLFSIHLDSDL